jgi:hypothetical protein
MKDNPERSKIMKTIAIILGLTAAALAQQPKQTKLYFTQPAPFTTRELVKRCPKRVMIIEQSDAAQYHLTIGFSYGVTIFNHQWAATLFDATANEAVAVFRTGSRSGLAKEICQYFANKDHQQ